MGYALYFDAVWASFDRLLTGLGIGVAMALVSLALGTALGLGLALLARALPAAGGLVTGYVLTLRNLPLLVLVLLVYFALPQLGPRLDKYQSFTLALTLYASAYLVEVFRAGLASVPLALVEAGRAIGLTRGQTGLYVVLPVMLRNVLPALGNTFIGIFKDTSIAAAIAVPELTFEARKLNGETFRVIETWLVVSALYVATCTALSLALRGVERRFPRF